MRLRPLRSLQRALVAGVAAGALAAVPASAAAAEATTSTNWAGYVASDASAGRFTSVSGAWVEPTATCKRGRAAYSAVWVGLGGYSSRSSALEQIGTDADCTRNGQAIYSSWLELLPAAPINLRLAVHAGDRMVASVTVIGRHATLRIRDLTTGKRYSSTRRLSSIDVSSAEWIVEAPSQCASSSSCQTLPLSDFGTVAFSSATATAAGHTGPISDSDWSSEELLLRQAGASAGEQVNNRELAASELVSATPSASEAASGAFTVTWSQELLETQSEGPEGPTQPGFGGGPP